MPRYTSILLLHFLIISNCLGQKNYIKKQKQSIYSNWIGLDYLNCLKTDLPCECEKSKEFFLISLDTTKKFILLYEGRANYDYNQYDLKTISPNNLVVYENQYYQNIIRDSITTIGQINIKNDTLHFTTPYGFHTIFVFYNIGFKNDYLYEHIKLLNSAFEARGYLNLSKTLNKDSLKCCCNWELDRGVNIVYGNDFEWILEKKNNELSIYEWKNRPIKKSINLKIEKKLIKKLKW